MHAKHLWSFPLTLVVCVGASLLLGWLLSRPMGIVLNPTLVAAITLTGIAVAVAIHRR